MLHTALLITLFGQVFTGELTVLEGQTGGIPPNEMMAQWLNHLSETALNARLERFEALKTPEDCTAYQTRMRIFFEQQLGGWPERTDLNAQIVSEETRDGYRLQRIIFESQPKFFVTALMFLPLTPPPYPGVLVPCGHSDNGKASEAYQRVCILLARNGLAALIYDPIGQGERLQLLNEQGKRLLGSTLEHTLVGVGAILTGMNTATIRIWDGMRGIDYLCSRDDIDPARIGCTGNSGGGTLTSYIMALDPRVKVAAPSCYLTSFSRLLEKAGPQDSEQDIYGQIAFGMDHADYVILRAPNPTLMCCATKDFFDIRGAWDSFRQAKRFYGRMGYPERVDLAENDDEHGFTKPLRIAAVRWMRRWLLNADDAITEPDFPVLTDAEAQCSPDGQVLHMDGARSVWDLINERAGKCAEKRKAFWAQTPKEEIAAKIRALTGIADPAPLPADAIVSTGTITRDGVTIEKIVLKPEPGIFLSGLLFSASTPPSRACLYLHGDGKEVDAAPGGRIEQLARDGALVFAVDMRGIGETDSRLDKSAPFITYIGADWKDFYRAYLHGKPYVGLRAMDALICARYLAERFDASAIKPVDLIAIGEAAIPALHAQYLWPDAFAHARLERMTESWTRVAHAPLAKNQLVNTVHDALSFYDLPELMSALPAGAVEIITPLTPEGQPAQ